MTARHDPVPRRQVERRLGLMGTSLEVMVLAADRSRALELSEQAVRALERTEERLSTWRATSELERLNRSVPGEPMRLSAELEQELGLALQCSKLTGGLFDPTVGSLVQAWGLRGGGRVPSADELARARASTGTRLLALGPGEAARLDPGLRIEEGGFGKGAGLDRALKALRAGGAERAWLDLGGQVAVLSPRGRPFRIGVADPRERGRAAIELVLASGSLATTGQSERGITIAGRRYGHILDPRSGRPAEDFGSLSVWSESALSADCLATGLYVLGPQAAVAWAARHPGVEALALETGSAGLRALITPDLARGARPVAHDLTLQTVEAAGAGRPPSFHHSRAENLRPRSGLARSAR